MTCSSSFPFRLVFSSILFFGLIFFLGTCSSVKRMQEGREGQVIQHGQNADRQHRVEAKSQMDERKLADK